MWLLQSNNATECTGGRVRDNPRRHTAPLLLDGPSDSPGRMTRTDDSEVPDYPGRLRLDGKGVVVLGAGQGIGRQASHALAQSGAKVLAVDLDADLAADIAKEVDGFAWSGDATSREDVAALWQQAETQLGRVHAVVDIIGMSR